MGELQYFTNLNVSAIWGSCPFITMIPRSGGQWGRYNLHRYIKSGWWYTYPSEKYEFLSWDDDIPNIYGKS